MRQLAHAEVVDDEQGHEGEIGEQRLAGPVERGVGDLFDQRMGLAIDDAVALLNRGAAEGLREMAFAGAGRVSYIVPIILRQSRCTTGGIRCTDRRCWCGAARGIDMGTMSFAGSLMTRSVRCRRGCLIPPVPSRHSVPQ